MHLRAPLVLSLFALTACVRAPVTRADWYREARGPASCSWKKPTRWYDTGVLLAPNLGVPMARWAQGHSAKNWDGAQVTGALQRTGPYYLFVGTWQGNGLIVDAEVDATDEPMFFAYTTVSIGRAGVLSRGADVRVVGDEVDHVYVQPAKDALSVFTPIDEPTTRIACSAVTLYPQRVDVMKWAGFEVGTPLLVLNAKAAVPVFDQPGGTQVGTFNATPEPLYVHRLEAREGWTRVAYEHHSGVVWHGWVQAPLEEPKGTSDLLGALVGGLGLAKYEWKACAVEQRLFARLNGELVWVGRVLPTTPFRIEATEAGSVRVRFLSNMLAPVEGVSFELGAGAAQCGPWFAPEFKLPSLPPPPAPPPSP